MIIQVMFYSKKNKKSSGLKRFEIKYLVVRDEIKEEQTIIRTAKLQVGLNMSMIGSIRI